MQVVNSSHTLPAKQLANLDTKAGTGTLSWSPDEQQQQQQQAKEQVEQQQPRKHAKAGKQPHPLCAGVCFWPLPQELKGAELCVEVGPRAMRPAALCSCCAWLQPAPKLCSRLRRLPRA